MKNKKKLLIAALLILAIVSIGSYAIYKSTATGTSGFKTAKWYIELNDQDITTTNTFTFDLKAADWTHNAVIDSDETELVVIAPGSYGTFGIELDATETEVDVSYTLTARVLQNNTEVELSTINPNLSLGFYENDTLKSNPLTGSITAHGTYNGEIRIIWNEVDSTDSNSSDININDQDFVVEVTVVTRQKSLPTAAEELLESKLNSLNNIPDTDIYIFKGENPGNYVNFNNEIWRIVGIYEDNIKLVRATSLDRRVFRTSYSQDDSNVWSASELKDYLIGDYYENLDSSAQEMIENSSKWYVAANDQDNSAYTSYTTSIGEQWTGKVAILAPYEFLYASDGEGCSEVSGYHFDNACGTANHDWLKPNYSTWTISAVNFNKKSVIYIASSGFTANNYTNGQLNVYPSVFLKSNVMIAKDGNDGSSPEQAYNLVLN